MSNEELEPYGFCPACGKKGISRERGINGNDKCEGGHKYPSANAKKTSKLEAQSCYDMEGNEYVLMQDFERAKCRAKRRVDELKSWLKIAEAKVEELRRDIEVLNDGGVTHEK